MIGQLRVVRMSVLTLSLTASLWGCGGGGSVNPPLELVPTSLTVTLDGKPLADADVSLVFQGPAPKGFTGSGGRTDANGKLEVKTGQKSGTVVGTFKALVNKLMMPDGSPIKNDPASGIDLEQLRQQGQVKETVPERYTSIDTTDLTVNVAKGGKNELELKLSGS